MSLFGCVVSTKIANAFDLYLDPKPQASAFTCQSYAVMLALAHFGHSAYKLETPRNLREAELEFRRHIDAEAATTGQNKYSHKVWKAAFSKFTQQRLKLIIKYIDDVIHWRSEVARITGVDSVQHSNLISSIITKRIVMTSVTSLSSEIYNSGHIISILGIDSKLPLFPYKVLALNSAIKSGGNINRCDEEYSLGDTKYSAGILRTDRFKLKKFGNKYLLMYISK